MELKRRNGVLIVLLHRVHEDPRPWDLSPEELEELCRAIVAAGLRDRVVTYSLLAKLIETSGS